MDLAFEDLDRIGKTFSFESKRPPELFCQVGMRLLLIGVIVEHVRIGSVFNHAERKRFENRFIVQITLIRHYCEPAKAMSPCYSRGQWDTASRATPQSPQGDVPCGRGLRATCTRRCPRLPVSPLSLTALGPQVLSD
jgi:hypothetical protein